MQNGSLVYEGVVTGGSIEIAEAHDSPGGKSKVTEIILKGGYFHQTEIVTRGDRTVIKIIGEYEAIEFFEAMKLLGSGI